MATVAYPSPELYAAVLESLSTADIHQATVSDALSSLIKELTDDEAKQLPDAIESLLPLLREDLARLRFASEVLVEFDLFEATETLAHLAIELQDDDILRSAAALGGNPGVTSAIKKTVLHAMGNHWTQIMLNDTIQPMTEEEKLLHEQRWPGSRALDGNPRLAPVAVLDKSLPAKQVLELAINLINAGVTVRRLGADNPLPNWFGPQTIVLCRPRTRTRILSRQPSFSEKQIIVDPRLTNQRDYDTLMRKCDAVIVGSSRLRLSGVDTLPQLIWDPEVYKLGVYTTYEAEFLTSAPKSALYRLAKQGLLKPRRAKVGDRIWSFRDLVAVRTWRYMNSESRRRIQTNIIPALARFAGDSKAVSIGATSSGQVLVDHGNGWVNPLTGEQPLDLPITDVDKTFNPFELGGNHAPNMLETSDNTRLNPAILSGVPYLKDFRIPAQFLAEIHQRGGEDAITEVYPKLHNIPIADTLNVGYKLAAAGRGFRL